MGRLYIIIRLEIRQWSWPYASDGWTILFAFRDVNFSPCPG